jgi:hypothetical protein
MFYFIYTGNTGEVTNATKRWNIIKANTAPKAVVDENNSSSALTVSVPGITLFSNAVTLAAFPWTGDGSWYDENVNDPVWVNNATFFPISTVAGLDAAKSYFIDVFGYHQDGVRTVELNINGGTAQGYSLSSGTVVDDSTFSVSGITSATLNARQNGGSAGYVLGFRVREAITPPSITLTQTEITPNGTISGSYANWGGTAPTKLEGIRGANTIGSDTGEITGFTATGDGTSGTFTATIADLPASTSTQYLRFSDTGIVNVTWRLS